jgi:tetratricopeptide (TPR) repeat protein
MMKEPMNTASWRRALFSVPAIFFAGSLLVATAAGQQINAPRSAPHDGYWSCFGPFLEGDFRTAVQGFREAAKDGIMNLSTKAPGPWVDAVCYHAMIGECHYQMGALQEALDEFNAAARFYLAHRDWMLRIDFPQAIEPQTNSKTAITWGTSSRSTTIGTYKPRYSSLTGRLDNQNVVRGGGVIETPVYYPVYAIEVVRCTTLAISRRRELLGPLAEHDPLTGQLVEALARYPAPPNHWSQCFAQLELGVAYAAANRIPQAVAELQKSLQARGQFDHPLTCVALLELGRIAYEQGKYEAAITYFHEATISGAHFERRDVLEEAFRLGAEAHLLAGRKGAYPPLAPAAATFSRVRWLHASLLASLAEQLITMGEVNPATNALAQAKSTIGRREMVSGAIGARLNYQSARLAGRNNAFKAIGTALNSALAYQKSASRRLFHINVADAAYRGGGLTERIADLVYTQVLREPAANDWLTDPLDTLALISSPHVPPLERWLELALERKEVDKAINIAERIRRHKYLVSQPLGGRILGLRWVLEGPEERLTAAALLQRQSLIVKYPDFAELSRRAADLKVALRELPLVPDDEPQRRKQQQTIADLARVSDAQEQLLQQMALERLDCDLAFPPLMETRELQERLPAGTMALYFQATSRQLHCFTLSTDRYSHFALSQTGKLKNDIAEFLRQIGNLERNHTIAADELRLGAWQTTARRISQQLMGGIKFDNWSSIGDLVIVPDGTLWYLPLEALPAASDLAGPPLVGRVAVRYAPLLALGVQTGRRRTEARTAVIAGKLLPRDDEEVATLASETVGSVAGDHAIFRRDFPSPSAVSALAADRLIVLTDYEDSDKIPLGWAPAVLDAGKPGSTLADWVQLPLGGPEQLVLPGFHTQAENGLKRGGNGDEIFLTACSLMASGCQTVLLSRWRVGGQSTVDLLREFIQELPHQPAAAAWRRSVQLAGQRRLDLFQEGRIRAASASEPIRGDHPFFWGGYMLLDTRVGSQE